VQKETARKVINIKVYNGTTPKLTDSKFAGYPYWTANMDYPVDSDGNKLILLAQINLKDVQDDYFPKEGLLQFFISDDDCNGLCDEKGYKVVYHPNIDESITEEDVKAMGIRSASDLDQDEEYMPLYKCLSIRFEASEEPIGSECYDFEDKFLAVLKDVTGIDANDYVSDAYYKLFNFLNDDDSDYVMDFFEGSGHKMLGYPYFTQEDPRDNGEKDVLLFQMDSEMTGDDSEIMWGDSGVCNFFISDEDLKALNFDRVLYNWDCC
jgi:uncharacterized protein YwqG